MNLRLAFPSLLIILAVTGQSGFASLPPFVSDRFDLYQIGEFPTPVTFFHTASSGTTETFSGAIDVVTHAVSKLNFYPSGSNEWVVWSDDLAMIQPDGTMYSAVIYWTIDDEQLKTSFGPSWPWEREVGFIDDTYTASFQIDWIEPSGGRVLIHVFFGILFGTIGDFLCVPIGWLSQWIRAILPDGQG